jgi:hypothetical protein
MSSEHSRIVVEVKILDAETETKIYGKGWVPQVQKYLDFKDGSVAYLTTKAVSTPDVKPKDAKSKRFLGHRYFEDLYDRLAKVKLTDIGEMFKQFMEENGMKRPDPFTQKELDNATRAFSFAKKCEAFLNEINMAILLTQPPATCSSHGCSKITRRPFSNLSVALGPKLNVLSIYLLCVGHWELFARVARDAKFGQCKATGYCVRVAATKLG